MRTTRMELFGVSFEIETDSPDFRRAVSERLPPSESGGLRRRSVDRRYTLEQEGGRGAGWVLRRGLRKPVLAPDVGAAADLLVEDAERLIAHRAPKLVFVHAGAVVWRGRAILLPGRSGAGKSELVAALLKAGAGYFSDEFAVIDPRGRVHAYPRRLALRRRGGPDRLAPGALGGKAAASAVPAAMIALLRYREGFAYRVRAISRGEAVLALLANTVAARKRFELARGALVSVAASAVSFRGTRGPAEEAAHILLSEVDRLSAGAATGVSERSR